MSHQTEKPVATVASDQVRLPIPEYLPLTVLDPAILEKLTKIRSAFMVALGSHPTPFPLGWCMQTAAFVEEEIGLPRVGGQYRKSGFGFPHPHHWNKTRDGLHYIDLTQDQFGSDIPPIAILSTSTHKLRELDHVRRLSRDFRVGEDVSAAVRKYLL